MKRKSGYVVTDFSAANSSGAGNLTNERFTPLQAIRHACWACCGGHEFPWLCGDGKIEPPFRPYDEVRECTNTTCYLFPYKTGRNPYSGHKGNVANLIPNKRKEDTPAIGKERKTEGKIKR